MSNDEERMQDLEDEILLCTDIDDCRSTIQSLGSFGQKALERLTRLRKETVDKKIIQALNYEIVRINKGAIE